MSRQGGRGVPQSWKGVIAGFIATAVLSVIMMVMDGAGFNPQFNIVTLLDNLGSIGRAGAWADHFIVGMLLWGPIFAGFDSVTPKFGRWLKGMLFGMIAWVMMMLLFMPVVGMGLFGASLGIMGPVVMLIFHLIYGAVLGLSFGLLDAWLPEKARSAEPPLAG
jgi:hypothetical protein